MVEAHFVGGAVAQTHVAHWATLPRRVAFDVTLRAPGGAWRLDLPASDLYGLSELRASWRAFALNWQRGERLEGLSWLLTPAGPGDPMTVVIEPEAPDGPALTLPGAVRLR